MSFMDYELGQIDLEERSLQPLENPFEVVNVQPACPEQTGT